MHCNGLLCPSIAMHRILDVTALARAVALTIDLPTLEPPTHLPNSWRSTWGRHDWWTTVAFFGIWKFQICIEHTVSLQADTVTLSQSARMH